MLCDSICMRLCKAQMNSYPSGAAWEWSQEVGLGPETSASHIARDSPPRALSGAPDPLPAPRPSACSLSVQRAWGGRCLSHPRHRWHSHFCLVKGRPRAQLSCSLPLGPSPQGDVSPPGVCWPLTQAGLAREGPTGATDHVPAQPPSLRMSDSSAAGPEWGSSAAFIGRPRRLASPEMPALALKSSGGWGHPDVRLSTSPRPLPGSAATGDAFPARRS